MSTDHKQPDGLSDRNRDDGRVYTDIYSETLLTISHAPVLLASLRKKELSQVHTACPHLHSAGCCGIPLNDTPPDLLQHSQPALFDPSYIIIKTKHKLYAKHVLAARLEI